MPVKIEVHEAQITPLEGRFRELQILKHPEEHKLAGGGVVVLHGGQSVSIPLGDGKTAFIAHTRGAHDGINVGVVSPLSEGKPMTLPGGYVVEVKAQGVDKVVHITKPAETPSPRPAGLSLNGASIDVEVLRGAYDAAGKDLHLIGSEKAMSAGEIYTAQWVVREFVQNLVDHNPHTPGTLDGVGITEEDAGDGKIRFRLEGDWVFDDYSSLVSFHSEKPAGRPTAGGMGFGVKQAALVMANKFGVRRFDIDGEDWRVCYRTEEKGKYNDEGKGGLRFNWTVADVIKGTGNRGKNTVIVETDNTQLIDGFRSIRDIGVCRENRFLQEMDFSNANGEIKWIQPVDGVLPSGRLFLLGQAMPYKLVEPDAPSYFGATEGVTLRLNGVEYKKTLDRQGVLPRDMERYLAPLVESMSPEDLITQLKRSEGIWTQVVDDNSYTDRKAAFLLIEKLVWRLYSKTSTKRTDFEATFGPKYLAADKACEPGKRKLLEAEGWKICPGYFRVIGMKTLTEHEGVEAVAKIKPDPKAIRQRMTWAMRSDGAEVPCEEIKVEGKQLLAEAARRLRQYLQDVKVEGGKSVTFTLKDDGSFMGDIERCLNQQNPGTGSDPANAVYALRGLIKAGLAGGVISDSVTKVGTTLTTYTLDEVPDSAPQLFVRNSDIRNVPGNYIRFEVTDPAAIAELTGALAEMTNPVPVKELDPVGGGPAETKTRKPSALKRVLVSAAALAAAAGVGIWLVGKKAESSGRLTDASSVTQMVSVDVKSPPKDRVFITGQSSNQADTAYGSGKGVVGSGRVDVVGGSGMSNRPGGVSGVGSVHGGVFATGKVDTVSGPKPPSKLGDAAPKVLEAINALDALASSAPKTNDVFDQYGQWKSSGQYYGNVGATNYLSGRGLIEVLQSYEQSVIEPKTDKMPDDVDLALGALINKLSADGDQIEGFRLVTEPSKKQLAQLGLAREYFNLATGVKLDNDLFIFEGKGAKGVTLASEGGKGAVGIHSGLFSSTLWELTRTLSHEVAHTNPAAQGHDVTWRATWGSILLDSTRRMADLARKLEGGGKLTFEEKRLLEMERIWDELRK